MQVAAAHERWLALLQAAGWQTPLPDEEVRLRDARGRVLAEAVHAARPVPAYDASAMDGYAVASASLPGRLRIGTDAIEVDTGDPLPEGRDAVVPLEHATRKRGHIEVAETVFPRAHVRGRGEDIAEGALVVSAGTRLGPAALAACAAAGVHAVRVARRPRVLVLPTGDEVVAADADAAVGSVPDTNSLMLCLQAEEAGASAEALPVAPDDCERIAAALREAAARCDLLLVCAGSSAGRDDRTADAIAETGAIAVHGVDVRPGHPVVLGHVAGVPAIGVPGYPISAALTFERFAAPLLAQLAGAATPVPTVVRARLAGGGAGRAGVEDQVLVQLDRVGGTLLAHPVRRGASRLASLLRADGLVVVPPDTEHVSGDDVDVRLLRNESATGRTAAGSLVDAVAAEADGQRAALAGDARLARAAFDDAAAAYLRSFALAPHGSWGRAIGSIKCGVLAGDGRQEAVVTAAAAAGEPSPTARYASALAALVLGEDELALGAASAMREGGEAFTRTADAIAALAEGDRARYAAALRSILADFEARDEFLTGVPFADTAAVLEQLAGARGLAARPGSALLPV